MHDDWKCDLCGNPASDSLVWDAVNFDPGKWLCELCEGDTPPEAFDALDRGDFDEYDRLVNLDTDDAKWQRAKERFDRFYTPSVQNPAWTNKELD